MSFATRLLVVGIGAASFLSLASCGGTTTPSPTTITGTLEQAGFPSAVSTITVRTDKGDSKVAVDSSGAFKLELPAGATYQFLLAEDGASIPMVLRAVNGRYDTTVLVKTAGAKLDIGVVKYWPGAGSQFGLTPLPAVASSEAAGTCEDSGVDCEDGIDTATGLECDGGPAANQDDGEEDDGGVNCEDGIDSATGLECDGGPAANQDDGAEGDEAEDTDCQASDEMGLPQFNLPDEIGCGDEDEGEGGEED